jgi:tRNA1Val (adenine37-N6)-methyltransferase
MSNPYFKFKQFTVYHDKCAMKVGIDAVLLGAWTPIENSLKILDIGTGSGLIALMLAQQNAVLQATENVKNSLWDERIKIFEDSIQSFAKISSERFDLIVSNPPYFVNSLKTPFENRNIARHTNRLTHEELIEDSIKLLNPKGRICIILPVVEGLKCIEFAEKAGLFCSKQIIVFPKPGVDAKRLLLEFKSVKSEKNRDELTIESMVRNQYSPEFSALVKDFYLK